LGLAPYIESTIEPQVTTESLKDIGLHRTISLAGAIHARFSTQPKSHKTPELRFFSETQHMARILLKLK